jgi:NRPS condensation-like uncharacterized protein
MAPVKKIKTEAFDIMQYYYGTIHDPLIHCSIRFSGYLDEAALKKAVTLSEKALPLLRCCFEATVRRPYWKDHGFTAEDIVQVIEAGPNEEAQKEQLLASTIDIARGPQLQIYLVKGKSSDTLCIIINHMICDGAGFKEYIYLLSDLYTQCHDNIDFTPSLESPSRSAWQLFTNFSFLEKLNILFAKYDLAIPNNQLAFDLQGDNNNPFLVTQRIPKEDFLAIKGDAKKWGVTVNDLILTAYIRILHRKLRKDTIILPCPVDLRKYLSPHLKHGICNLTGDYICNVTLDENESFEDTLIKVAGQMQQQKSSTNCLKGVMLLEFIFRVFPFRAVQKILRKTHTIPVVSFTNLGVIDKQRLHFGVIGINDAYMTGAIRHVPYFQMAVSTYDDSCTLSSNLHGTPQDKVTIKDFLIQVQQELAIFRKI